MVCDYYIQNEMVIEYQNNAGKRNFIYTNRIIKKGYIFDYPSNDLDNNVDSYEKYNHELERRIKLNTYNKILFENGDWIKELYKKKYETYLSQNYKDIVKIIKVYKKTVAWKRT